MKYSNRALFLLGMLCLPIILSSCSNSNTSSLTLLPVEEPDPDFYRVTMGMGFVDRTDTYLYATDRTNVYEMDLQTKQVLPVKEILDPSSINVSDDTIYYRDLFGSTIHKYDLIGSKTSTVYDEAGLADIYVNDKYLYGLVGGRRGALARVDLDTGKAEEIVPPAVLMYDKYGSEIYYIFSDDKSGDTPVLKCYNEHTGLTKDYDLPFSPISSVNTEEYIYLVEQGRLIDGSYHYPMHRMKKSTEEIEDIDEIDKALEFYVFDDHMYYNDVEQDQLISYSLKDQTKDVLMDNVYQFTVFSDNTIVCFVTNDGTEVYNVYLERNLEGEWESTKVIPD